MPLGSMLYNGIEVDDVRGIIRSATRQRAAPQTNTAILDLISSLCLFRTTISDWLITSECRFWTIMSSGSLCSSTLFRRPILSGQLCPHAHFVLSSIVCPPAHNYDNHLFVSTATLCLAHRVLSPILSIVYKLFSTFLTSTPPSSITKGDGVKYIIVGKNVCFSFVL